MNTVYINYAVVFLCGIITMPVGALWYGPLPGKVWMKGMGLRDDKLTLLLL